jgi:hypothetical protein
MWYSGSSSEPNMSAPTRRVRSPCWARAASGHAAAVPSPAMKSRRLISHSLNPLSVKHIAVGAACLAFEAKVSQSFLQRGRQVLAHLGPEPTGRHVRSWRKLTRISARRCAASVGSGCAACRREYPLIGCQKRLAPKNGPRARPRAGRDVGGAELRAGKRSGIGLSSQRADNTIIAMPLMWRD